MLKMNQHGTKINGNGKNNFLILILQGFILKNSKWQFSEGRAIKICSKSKHFLKKCQHFCQHFLQKRGHLGQFGREKTANPA